MLFVYDLADVLDPDWATTRPRLVLRDQFDDVVGSDILVR